ncbi:hypothetical protein [Streptomyces sp. I05A-00742]|uniref:hypothetical protein n=1 Tax=Streptomyces sp. I05A-00742 TaxID=2732853 RepID=UPI0014879278|nr:hypothetical protein [Streptomyces sp. I05A-00742]
MKRTYSFASSTVILTARSPEGEASHLCACPQAARRLFPTSRIRDVRMPPDGGNRSSTNPP